MNNENQPSYYAIIPATIRYDENLKYAERLFYGEITALIGKDGYCFASNNYFAELYGVIPGTVSRWISHLVKLGYIKEELIRNDKNAIIERRIYITDISCRRVVQDTYKQNSTYPYKQNCLYPMSKKAKDSNINIRIDRFFNYIINNKDEIPKEFENMEQFQEFYEIIERLEFNYTEDDVQKAMRSAKSKWKNYYILKMDVTKYFQNIDKRILWEILKRKIKDKKLLWLTREILLSTEGMVGLPLGNYTSQMFANIYLNELDQYVKHKLKCKYYYRYMDDMVIMCENKEIAKDILNDITKFLKENLKLTLNSKTRIFKDIQGVNFCGYKINEKRLKIRHTSKCRMKRKLKRYTIQRNNPIFHPWYLILWQYIQVLLIGYILFSIYQNLHNSLLQIHIIYPQYYIQNHE